MAKVGGLGQAGTRDHDWGVLAAIEGASLRLNALFFSIVGLAAFIVALQMATLARWR